MPTGPDIYEEGEQLSFEFFPYEGDLIYHNIRFSLSEAVKDSIIYGTGLVKLEWNDESYNEDV